MSLVRKLMSTSSCGKTYLIHQTNIDNLIVLQYRSLPERKPGKKKKQKQKNISLLSTERQKITFMEQIKGIPCRSSPKMARSIRSISLPL